MARSKAQQEGCSKHEAESGRAVVRALALLLARQAARSCCKPAEDCSASDEDDASLHAAEDHVET
ncbi:MAG: hypothetical protein K0S81_2602 [Rhodospirillales bacterium]|nr:hypothetical protein [Rhodospirillales bacterium]